MISFILARLVRAIIVMMLTVTFVFIILRLGGDPGSGHVGRERDARGAGSIPNSMGPGQIHS